MAQCQYINVLITQKKIGSVGKEIIQSQKILPIQKKTYDNNGNNSYKMSVTSLALMQNKKNHVFGRLILTICDCEMWWNYLTRSVPGSVVTITPKP